MKETEENFDALRTLLTLKRHEVPPPGHFDRFSDEITSRIRRGDVGAADTWAGKLFAEAPWLLKLIEGLQAKPAYAGVLGAALCLLLVSGMVYTDSPTRSQDDIVPAQISENGSPMAVVPAGLLNQAAAPAISDSSTNPVLSLEPDSGAVGGQNPIFQTVNYNPSQPR